ncbi:MAG: Ig-like domain-containing protein, partial [Myxococcaceae bacterium]
MSLRRTLPLLLIIAGCSNVPSEDRGAVTQAVFDPTRSDIPTPNDLAMKDGAIAIEENPYLSSVENELKMSLNGRDGFSTGSSSRVRFTDQLSASSFSDDTVFALDLGVDGKDAPKRAKLTPVYSECDASLSFNSDTGLLPGHRYLFAIRGGEKGVKDSRGNEVYAMPAFHLLRAGKDLREHLDAIPGATLDEKKAAAEKLEGIRQSYEPYFQALETLGLPRSEVVILWAFTTTKHGEVFFDPNSKKIPFPNDLLRDPATGIVSVPADPKDLPEAKALKAGLNTLDGFSTTAAFYFETNTAIDRATVAPQKTLRLFAHNDDGTVTENLNFTVKVSDDAKRVTIQPTKPLLPKTPYDLVVTGLKSTDGQPLFNMPLQQLLALDGPLLDDQGKSQISVVCADTAKRLEPIRQNLAPALAALGADRMNVSAAYSFTTLDVVKHFQELWRIPYDSNLPLAVTNVDSGSPFDRGYWAGPLAMPSVSKIITGKMTTMEFLDPTTRAWRTSGVGSPKQVDFVLTIPTGLTAGAKIPVLVFGHGLYTERRLGLMLAERVAANGMALMAIDLPCHGERSYCTADNMCNIGGTCRTDGTCSNDFLRTPAFFLGTNMGKGTPLESPAGANGGTFIDVQNLPASRDHFRQAIIDLSAQTRLIKLMDWKSVSGGHPLDSENISYAGISLGGIMGGTMSGVDPSYSQMLLNVGGAGLPELM